ncbi:MAG TPA: hypothetical protein VFR09_02885 [Alphaproteobacteria bacterium]|nr:hypothetical protein [Alphaproteobacteria bacterium]
MKPVAKSLFYFTRCAAIALVAGMCTQSLPARADDDPFSMDSVQWMSFDRYKDSIKHGGSYEPVPVVKPETPYANTDADDAHYLDGSTDKKTSTPAIASPMRPVNPPVMPGMNKGFDVQVGTTEDDRPPVAQIAHIDTDPTVQMQKNWETTKEAMRRLASKKGSDDPLDVRMSFLPSTSIKPIPDPATPHSTENKNVNAAMSVAAVKKQDPNAADYAKWSAELDAYKKRQLAAIQSDRETLAALQAAISQLGLQKQLDFMPGSGNLSQQADYAAPAGVDTPAPSITALGKN